MIEPLEQPPRERREYGVATSQYDGRMSVQNQFDSLVAAQEFARNFIPGCAVICRYSDGRWRSIQGSK